jgi:hypothetical protein
MLLDVQNLETITELVQIRSSIVPFNLFAYLRSVLMRKNYSGEGKELIIVSSPRVIEFEIFVIDWAIDLIDCYSE